MTSKESLSTVMVNLLLLSERTGMVGRALSELSVGALSANRSQTIK